MRYAPLFALALIACGSPPNDTDTEVGTEVGTEADDDTGDCAFEGDTVPVNVRVFDPENSCFGPRIAEQRDASLWTDWAVNETCGGCGDSEAVLVDDAGRCLYVNHWCDEGAPNQDPTLVGGCGSLHDTDLGSEHPCCAAYADLTFCE